MSHTIEQFGNAIVVSVDNPTPNDMELVQDMMDLWAEEMKREILELAQELEVDDYCASQVYYLRTRSRHTPELEMELIKLHHEGNPPNINEWPPNYDE